MSAQSPQVIYAGSAGYAGPQDERHWMPQDLFSRIQQDMSKNHAREPFQFMYQVFETMIAHLPRAMKDVSRFYRPDQEPDYREPDRQRAVEIAASDPAYAQNPAARHMARCALADPSYATSVGLLSQSLEHYLNFKYLGKDHDYEPLSPLDPQLSSFDPKLPFRNEVEALWRDAEGGRFTAALEKLLPLVNVLAEREANGVFPIGMSVGGVDMAEMRYLSRTSQIWAINKSTDENRNAILINVVEQGEKFFDERAKIYAANMLAMMADHKSGAAAHLPGDLQWLMVCKDEMDKGKPVPKGYPERGYPDTPWDYDPKPMIELAQ